MRKIVFAFLILSVFADALAFAWSGLPSSSVNLANSAGTAVVARQNLAKGEAWVAHYRLR